MPQYSLWSLGRIRLHGDDLGVRRVQGEPLGTGEPLSFFGFSRAADVTPEMLGGASDLLISAQGVPLCSVTAHRPGPQHP